MTNEEALMLKEGDRVATKVGSSMCNCRVTGIFPSQDKSYVILVYVRREGKSAQGRLYPILGRPPVLIRQLPNHDPLEGNIYADVLEEHGHLEAANLLRRMFPLADGKPLVEVLE